MARDFVIVMLRLETAFTVDVRDPQMWKNNFVFQFKFK